MGLTKLIYASNHGGQSAGALHDILETSRANNKRDGITGVLVAGEEDFMQLLEGEKDAISICFMRIMKDKRHQNIWVIQAGDAVSRLFPKWSMHCIETSRVDKAIMSRYLINGSFFPTEMSQASIEGLCDDLSLRKIWG
ncbi:BLUF domain-containing protein [Paracoccus liaowanqingii]|uniref:BLUF domain-containing protein n=1 Tax=Paracoccus liaowanqingii TaxID=2560053 RepID=A0A4Z1BZI4_9RHOB|nr:BLUF domain-containing protein [Paracoccus liaowanqingii]TGN49788.1 BLUF domain-containing protein [Paracoccus liaowanqingii]